MYPYEKYEILDYIPDSYRYKKLGSGAHGTAYLTEDGMVFKELNNGVKYPDDLRAQTTLESKYFAFPRRITYLGERSDDRLTGYLCHHKDGVVFDDIPGTVRLDSIITASSNLEVDMTNLTRYYGVVVDDLDNNGVFDTEQYECFSLEEYPENIKKNIRAWAEYLLYNMGAYLDAFKDWKLNMHFESAVYYGKFRPSEFLRELVEAIRKASGEQIETLDDYDRYFSLIKKRGE